MSGSTSTPTVSGGSSTVSGGSGSTTTTGGSSTVAPVYNYVVTQPGNGYAVGTLISDAATCAELAGTSPTWAVRVTPGQMGS